MVGKLLLRHRDPFPTTIEVNKKLVDGLGIDNMKVTMMGKGLFHVILYNLNDHSRALTVGSRFFKPGVARCNRWLPRRTLFAQTKSSIQVYIRILNLHLEFCKAQNLLNITTGVILPIESDPLHSYHIIFARVLVAVDFSKLLPRRTRVTKKEKNSDNVLEFFVR